MKAWNELLWRRPSTYLALVVYGCGVGLTVYVVLSYVRQWVEIPPSVYGGLAGGITGGSGVVVVTNLWRRRLRLFLRQRLATLGVPICIKCGYDLRAQSRPRCPECFTPFDPALLQDLNSPRDGEP